MGQSTWAHLLEPLRTGIRHDSQIDTDAPLHLFKCSEISCQPDHAGLELPKSRCSQQCLCQKKNKQKQFETSKTSKTKQANKTKFFCLLASFISYVLLSNHHEE